MNTSTVEEEDFVTRMWERMSAFTMPSDKLEAENMLRKLYAHIGMAGFEIVRKNVN
jgi:hypothetical protein